MKNLLANAALLVVCGLTVIGQAPAPTPPLAGETDVVKITTALIQLDVTVTDRKGKIVTDLRPDEIEVYENGQRQKITNFSFVSNAKVIEAASTQRAKPGQVVPPPGPVRPEQVRRTIALVVDDLTLSFESMYYVRRALKKFVDEQMQEGDLVAIVRTGNGVGALQQFTNDKSQLHAAIERVRWNMAGVGGIGAFTPLGQTGAVDDTEEEGVSSARRTAAGRQREFNDFREGFFAGGTLGALDYVIRGLQELPGRKSIMLLSDGFKLFNRDASGFVDTGRVLQTLRRLVDSANRAAVTVYTMDARGLQDTNLKPSDDASGMTPQEMSRVMSARRNLLLDTQESLKFLAHNTGGIAVVNNNDLSGGIRKILDDQSYYLIGYEPDDATFDPKVRRFHQLEVRVKRPGTRVRYRSGFFGVSDETAAATSQTPAERLGAALISPFGVQGIPLRLNALYYNTPAEGNVIRSLVHIRAQDIRFTDTPEGEKQAVLEVLAAGFGEKGIATDHISKTYTVTLKKAAYERAMQRGFVYDFSFPIKDSGPYQLRVAVRDHASNNIGSAHQFVNVPNLKDGRLQLSGVVVENSSLDDWKRKEAGQVVAEQVSTAVIDTSLRQFKRGAVMNFGFTIYNPKQAPAAKLSSQTRLFRDGKLVFESKPQPVPNTPGDDPGSIEFSSALALGPQMLPGDYVLQVVITDNLASSKRNAAAQFVQFEVVE